MTIFVVILIYKIMKYLKSTIFITTCLLMFAGCVSKVDPHKNVKKVVFAAKEKELIKSTTPYSFDVYNTEVLPQFSKKSVVFSPISHRLTLAMMLNSPDNSTEVFDGLTVDESNALCQKILDRLAYPEKNVEKSLYNCYIYNTFYGEEDDLADILSKWYYAETIAENFLNNEQKISRDFLRWINSRSKFIQLEKLPFEITNGIKRIYSNVTNFHGMWTDKFDPKDTKREKFTSLDGSTRMVDMMNIDESFPYFEDEGIKAVELPYGIKNEEGQTNYSMVVIVTDDGELSYEDWELVQNNLMYKKLKLGLPKFEIKTDRIDFIVPGNSDAQLTQTAIIEVDESGTKATAITIGIDTTAMPEIIEFKVDKTFHFVIREKDADIILFMGRHY